MTRASLTFMCKAFAPHNPTAVRVSDHAVLNYIGIVLVLWFVRFSSSAWPAWCARMPYLLPYPNHAYSPTVCSRFRGVVFEPSRVQSPLCCSWLLMFIFRGVRRVGFCGVMFVMPKYETETLSRDVSCAASVQVHSGEGCDGPRAFQ